MTEWEVTQSMLSWRELVCASAVLSDTQELIMQMTQTYQAAINGTLASQEGGHGTGNPLTFWNKTCIPLTMYVLQYQTGERLGWDGESFAPGQPGYLIIPDGASMTQTNPTTGWYFLFTNAYSGAFVAVFETPESGGITITNYDALEPNDIGTFPTPSDDVVIPSDSALAEYLLHAGQAAC
ncbi:hypothetical protein AB0945_41505 [Streptomyces sp. NPDC005474]|uniref:hypothetical protein n=1 Tax=Streptomyces sp. NPDC005474 TaxID=3154878 RepID=UPI003452AC8B